MHEGWMGVGWVRDGWWVSAWMSAWTTWVSIVGDRKGVSEK